MNHIYLLFFLLLCVSTQGQSKQKDELKNLFETPEHPSYNSYIKNSSNELEFTAALLFVGYKAFFSSQDMQSCVFHPSCSVYAIECFKEEKFPKSIFKIFDRLTRCHPLASPKHYKIHKSGQLYDPVKN